MPFKIRPNRRGKKDQAQLELGIRRHFESDRNYSRGGRSFYFFDFDDNIAILSTPIFIFHKESGHEIPLSSREFAETHRQIGVTGPYKDYKVDFNDEVGSFRSFRDRNMTVVEKVLGKKQSFVEDLAQALGLPEYIWKGPSWATFYHAVFNKRPISMITARGHHPETIKKGIRLMINEGHLPHEPNYLSMYPINFPPVKQQLQKSKKDSTAELKQAAIRASVHQAFETYGHSEFHRFGMSDDDPRNIELIVEEMTRLKADYPEVSFFVFDTQKGQLIKREIFSNRTEDQPLAKPDQLPLF